MAEEAEGILSFSVGIKKNVRDAQVSEKIEGAQKAEFAIPTDVGVTSWYYCKITNTISGKTFSVDSNIIKADVERTAAGTPILSEESENKVRMDT